MRYIKYCMPRPQGAISSWFYYTINLNIHFLNKKSETFVSLQTCTNAVNGPIPWRPQTMTSTNHDGHKVYHDSHSNEMVQKLTVYF